MADEKSADSNPFAESYRLVGCRSNNQIRRVRAQLANTYVEADSFHAEALVKHGLPPDFWLPFELAIRWRTNNYPCYRTREAYNYWDFLQKEVVGVQSLSSLLDGGTDEMLADWEHDRALIAKFDPTLVGEPSPAAFADLESSEATAVPKSVAELLEWCQRQLLRQEDYVRERGLGPADQDIASHRVGRTAFCYAESFGPREFVVKLYAPPTESQLLTRGQSEHNLKALATWCEAELRHHEARGLLDAPQPRTLYDFKRWCDECVGVLRQQPLDEASYFAREAVGLAAVFCTGLVLSDMRAICVTVYPMLPSRAIRILEACSLACDRKEDAKERRAMSGDASEGIDRSQIEQQFLAKLEANRQADTPRDDSAMAVPPVEQENPLMVVKRRLERMQEERYFAILYAAGFTRDEVGKPGGLPFIGKRIEFDDPRYSAMKEAQAENLRMEAAKMELLRAWYRDYRHTSNEPDSKSNSITDAVSDENQADARPSPVIASSRVQLYGRSDPPLIDGTPSAALTAAQYDVVQALLAAGEKGLTKDALDRKSGRGDARKILSRLAKRDPKWEAVIAFAGKSGMGYRIL